MAVEVEFRQRTQPGRDGPEHNAILDTQTKHRLAIQEQTNEKWVSQAVYTQKGHWHAAGLNLFIQSNLLELINLKIK